MLGCGSMIFPEFDKNQLMDWKCVGSGSRYLGVQGSIEPKCFS